MAKLSNKQERFCHEYIKDSNGTQSAIRAGYSKRTAQQMATENLSKPVISQRIAELTQQNKSIAKKAIAEELLELRKLLVTVKLVIEAKELPTTVIIDGEKPTTRRERFSMADVRMAMDLNRRISELQGVQAELKAMDDNAAIERVMAMGYKVVDPTE